MTNLTDPKFNDEDAAREYFEAQRWPNGPFCPHCGNADPDAIRKLQGKSHRPGLYQCNACREHFTVMVGSVMERSHVPLTKWALGFHLMAASKKGMSAHQLMRMLGLGSYRTAWFLAHRIREAMRDDGSAPPIGGKGKIVEADETYFGKKEKVGKRTIRGKPGLASKRPVVALVERGGRARMFHVERATAATIRDVMVRSVSRKSNLHTDESNFYTVTGEEFGSHRTVHHTSGEYVRYDGDTVIHTNTVENVFSVFKRGMKGVYQHCSEKHLHRYVTEFEFRYNHRAKLWWSDADRAEAAIKGAAGKRLTYRQPRQTANA
jgi:transposase-like protein